jgi:hypothetical protein
MTEFAEGPIMSQPIRVAAALFCALALSGCFKSDYPLITVFDSVAPIPEGTYTYQDNDGKQKTAVITTELTVTKMITVDANGNPKLAYLLMRDVGDNYYVVQDAQNNYALIHIDDGVIEEYNEEDYCDDLKEDSALEGRSFSDYGAESNNSDRTSICKFTSFDGLVDAFQTLDDLGSLGVAREYRRR